MGDEDTGLLFETVYNRKVYCDNQMLGRKLLTFKDTTNGQVLATSLSHKEMVQVIEALGGTPSEQLAAEAEGRLYIEPDKHYVYTVEEGSEKTYFLRYLVGSAERSECDPVGRKFKVQANETPSTACAGREPGVHVSLVVGIEGDEVVTDYQQYVPVAGLSPL